MGVRRRTEAGPLRGSPPRSRGSLGAAEPEDVGRERSVRSLSFYLKRLGTAAAAHFRSVLHNLLALARRYYIISGLLAFWLLGTLLFLAHLANEAPGVCIQDEQGGRGGGSFTVVLNTYKRPDRLKKAIGHYALCEGVDAVRVVWSESDTPPHDWGVAGGAKVIFDVHEKNSINNRFVPLKVGPPLPPPPTRTLPSPHRPFSLPVRSGKVWRI